MSMSTYSTLLWYLECEQYGREVFVCLFVCLCTTNNNVPVMDVNVHV